jgi:hypothetical protein
MTFELFTANDPPAVPLPAARLRVVARFTDQSCRSLPIQTTLTLFALLMLFGTGVSAGETPQERLAKAEAMFEERCKTAGEKIYRTIDNVEGIFLVKLRPTRNFSNQFALDDPYGRDLAGDGYIESFLRGSYQANTRGTPAPGSPPRFGYLYVEAIDPIDGKQYRYTGRIEEPWQNDKKFLKGYLRFVIDKLQFSGPRSRYGVTYDDISTREEREYWIAGSSLKVIDLNTNEVIAERIGYMMDRGQGNTSAGRSPWLMAADNACPSFQRNPLHALPVGQGAAAQSHQTQDFVEKILKPKLGN